MDVAAGLLIVDASHRWDRKGIVWSADAYFTLTRRVRLRTLYRRNLRSREFSDTDQATATVIQCHWFSLEDFRAEGPKEGGQAARDELWMVSSVSEKVSHQ
jgi:hypothetical protein